MLSDVIVNIFNSHTTLYLNIMKAQGFYIHVLLRLFLFSQKRQGILSTTLYFHEPKDKCPCFNCLPQKRFTVSISLEERKWIHFDIPYQPFHSVCRLCNTQMHTKHSGASLPYQWVNVTCHESASRYISHKRKYRVGGGKKRTHSFSISWRYIKYCTRKTVYEKVGFFFQLSYLLKEVKPIHLTNLDSVCEQVARSTTAAKQKLELIKLFFQKGKVLSIQFHKNAIRRMWLKLGIYIIWTLISCNILTRNRPPCW